MDRHARIRNCTGLGIWLLTSMILADQSDNRREIQIHYERAQEAMKANQPEIAAQEFRAILRLDPDSAQAHANLGVIAFTQADYAKAAHDFRAALKLQPSLSNAQAFLGMCELRLGHVSEARTLLEKSFPHLQEAKLRTQAGMDLIQIDYETHDLDKAVDVLRVLERANPGHPDVLYTAYRTHSDLAAGALATLAKVAPESGRMHQILAQTLVNQDDFPGAIAQYRKALEIDPRLPGLHLELGQTILANSQKEPAREEAEKEFEAELVADPTDGNAEYELGEIYWLRSNLEAALQHYSRALELRPNLVDAQIAMGKVLTAMGQPQKALDYLLEATRLDPQNEVAHYRLAQAYRKLGRGEDADRERATFQKLRDSHAAIRSLYQQIQQRPVGAQTINSGEPQ